jgi:hypothetical protein
VKGFGKAKGLVGTRSERAALQSQKHYLVQMLRQEYKIQKGQVLVK